MLKPGAIHSHSQQIKKKIVYELILMMSNIPFRPSVKLNIENRDDNNTWKLILQILNGCLQIKEIRYKKTNNFPMLLVFSRGF